MLSSSYQAEVHYVIWLKLLDVELHPIKFENPVTSATFFEPRQVRSDKTDGSDYDYAVLLCAARHLHLQSAHIHIIIYIEFTLRYYIITLHYYYYIIYIQFTYSYNYSRHSEQSSSPNPSEHRRFFALLLRPRLNLATTVSSSGFWITARQISHHRALSATDPQAANSHGWELYTWYTGGGPAVAIFQTTRRLYC